MSNLPMNIIVAVDKCFGIGKNNTLPWHLRKEYAHFVQQTTSTRDPTKLNAVIMGRRCWESIPEKQRPLKNRVNVVLSRTMATKVEDRLIIANSIENALQLLDVGQFRGKIETLKHWWSSHLCNWTRTSTIAQASSYPN